MKAAVVIPTYNERENIEKLISDIKSYEPEIQIIVVDDNSPDGTGDVVDKLAQRVDGIEVVHREGKLGLGTAYLAGFKRALADGTHVVLTMDADFSHDPKFIPSLLDGSEPGIDLVIGSRYVPGGGVQNWPLRRQFLSKGANLFASKVLRLNSNDNTSGFRCYGRRLVENILDDPPKADGYSFLIEAVATSQQKGFCIRERPIIFIDRQVGITKISRQEILKALYTVFRLRFSTGKKPAV